MRAKRKIRHITHEKQKILLHFPWHTFVFVEHPSSDSHAKAYRKCVNCYMYGCITNCQAPRVDVSILFRFLLSFNREVILVKSPSAGVFDGGFRRR
jgi:hypothetical protein